jgi:hypothetical protein
VSAISAAAPAVGQGPGVKSNAPILMALQRRAARKMGE